jgi:hypothetical protein
MVAGAVMQGLLNNLFNSSTQTTQKTQEQLEAERLEEERIAYEAEMNRQAEAARQQELYDNLMKSSKPIPGSQSLDFKTLDGDMETIRKDAADQFEPKSTGNTIITDSSGTDFFGVPVSSPDFQILTEPEQTPLYKDVKTAVDLTDEYLENEKLAVKIIAQTINETRGEPIIEKPDCKAISEKLMRYRSDMVKFNEWNTGTLTELDKWKKQKDAAMLNAALDGINAVVGQYFDWAQKRGKEALEVKNILKLNEADILKKTPEKAEAIAKFYKILDGRYATCNAAEVGSAIQDHVIDNYALARNSIQVFNEKMTETDADYNACVKYLSDEGFLTDWPVNESLGILANKGIAAFCSFNNYTGIGLFAKLTQLAIDETFNITDIVTSYANICTLRDADGKASEAVKKIQTDMENMKIQLKNCP